MLTTATAAFGVPVVQRKLAQRLARRRQGGQAPVASGLAVEGAAGAGAPAEQALTGGAESPIDVASGGFSGSAGEIPYRGEMERSFGRDLSGVRAYTDESARGAAGRLQAEAYTVGDQVAFAHANPDRPTVAHELTHVLQQTGGSPARMETQAGGSAAEGAATDGIDTSGEAQAEAVEAAVRLNQPVAPLLGAFPGSASGAARKRAIARKSDGAHFGIFLAFSREQFEAAKEVQFNTPWPPIATAVPGMFLFVDPAFRLRQTTVVNHSGEKKGAFETGVDLYGEMGVGVKGPAPGLVEAYIGGHPHVMGSGMYEMHDGHWSVSAVLRARLAARVGVKLGGVVDHALEIAGTDLFRLTGLYWDHSGFRQDKLGFEWGPDVEKWFSAITWAAEKARGLGQQALARLGKAGAKVHDSIQGFTDWLGKVLLPGGPESESSAKDGAAGGGDRKSGGASGSW